MPWIVKENTLQQIIKMINRYLRAQNTKTMAELYTGLRTNGTRGRGWELANKHDLLGWNNFVEGRILKIYVKIQHR